MIGAALTESQIKDAILTWLDLEYPHIAIDASTIQFEQSEGEISAMFMIEGTK